MGIYFFAQVVKLVDTRDSKSRSGNRVRVQVPPWAPIKTTKPRQDTGAVFLL